MSHLLWLAMREMELAVRVMDQHSDDWDDLANMMEDQLHVLRHAYDNRGDADVSVEFFVNTD